MTFALDFFFAEPVFDFFFLHHRQVWFAAHSTPNPMGVCPPSHVHIVEGDKFGREAVEAAEWNLGGSNDDDDDGAIDEDE